MIFSHSPRGFAHFKSLRSEANAPQHRGFTLLISVILSSVILSVGLALADVAYKQVVLASTARQSQYAFYAADSALECALYWDQKQDEFDYTSEPSSGTITCENSSINFTTSTSGSSRTTTFSIPCASGGSQSNVVVYKQATGATSIYANGFNDCNASDPQRIERGEKSSY
jgi:Tfp pilus assembly protein PilE